jgi:hypothetical protein
MSSGGCETEFHLRGKGDGVGAGAGAIGAVFAIVEDVFYEVEVLVFFMGGVCWYGV